VPALFERVDRLEAAATLLGAISREPSSFHHVPGLVDLGARLAEKLGDEKYLQFSQTGSALDLNAAASYAKQQIELARRVFQQRTTAGRPGGLTRREVEVLRLVADGRTTGEIAARLFISAKTADSHIQHIYTKIHATNRATATRWAFDNGVVTSTSD
jgi:DNA-binding NarL/FixJ family response regulator